MGGRGAYMDAGADGGRRLGEEATLGGWLLAVCDRASPHLASGLGEEKGKEAWQRRRGLLILIVTSGCTRLRFDRSRSMDITHRIENLWQKTGDVMAMTPPCLLSIPAVTPCHSPYSSTRAPPAHLLRALPLAPPVHPCATEAHEPAPAQLDDSRVSSLSDAPPTPPPSLSASFPLLWSFPAHRLCLLQPMS